MTRAMLSTAIMVVVVLVVLVTMSQTLACGSASLERQAQLVLSDDPGEAWHAVALLRNGGPAGLDALFKVHGGLIGQLRTRPLEDDPKLRRLQEAVDAVGAQRDCHASRLYWYTNLEQAREAARQQNKPILSLRLLGELTDEYSCANSRFFRTALYANQMVSEYLRNHFVLHWETVRPVPRITIDFGDGRLLKRTITGNSVHYILNPEGHPVDAIPGLYGPRGFLEAVVRGEEMVRALDEAPGSRQAILAAQHRLRLLELRMLWYRDLSQITDDLKAVSDSEGGVHPTAMAAAHAAVSKSVVEFPVLKAMLPDDKGPEAIDTQTWQKIARLCREPTVLDDSSVALMRSKCALRVPLVPGEHTKSFDEMVERFEESIALDEVRNEYLLHSRIHEWFAEGEVSGDSGALNRRVYAELFLTPDSDPWLGLLPQNAYAALDGRGITSDRNLSDSNPKEDK